MINGEVLEQIIHKSADDPELLEIIFGHLKTFEEYHSAIFEMETKMKVYSYDTMSKEDYQDMVMAMDKNRTTHHNAVLTAVTVLNRLAASYDLLPVYDGVVSEQRPYRREVANAVLAYVEEIIRQRR